MVEPVHLSLGFLPRFLCAGKGEELQPILQIHNIQPKIDTDTKKTYYSLYLSDSKHFAEAKAVGAVETLLDEAKIRKGDLIQVLQFASLPIHEFRELKARQLQLGQVKVFPPNVKPLSLLPPDMVPIPLFPIPEWITFYEQTSGKMVDVSGAATSDGKSSKEPKRKKARTDSVADVTTVLPPIIPIAQVNEERQDEYAIIGQIFRKSFRELTSRADGRKLKILELDLRDDKGSEIRAVAWGSLAEKLKAERMKGDIVRVEGFRVQKKNAQYNPLSHDCELSLSEKYGVLTPLPASEFKAPALTGTTKIADIENRVDDSKVHLMCVVLQVGTTVTKHIAKSNTNKPMREILVADDSGASIVITLWGEDMVSEPDNWKIPGQIVGIKNVRVVPRYSDNRGTELSSTYSTCFLIGNNLVVDEKLAEWAAGEAMTCPEEITCLSKGKHLLGSSSSGSKQQQPIITRIVDLVSGSKGGLEFKIDGVVLTSIERQPDGKSTTLDDVPTCCWPSCPNPKCYAELQKEPDINSEDKEIWTCAKCGELKESQVPKMRFRMAITVRDVEASAKLQCNDNISRLILAHTNPEQLKEWLDQGKIDLINGAFAEAENKMYTILGKTKIIEGNSYRRLLLEVTDIQKTKAV